MEKPHLIHQEAVYDRLAAQLALGLTKTTLARELRLGRLRCSKRAGRYFILGKWLLEWLESGEVQRREPSEPAPPNSNAKIPHAMNGYSRRGPKSTAGRLSATNGGTP